VFRDRDGWLKPHQRIAVLRRLAALMEGRREHLALQIAREGGKPLPDAIVETTRAIDGVHNAADELRNFAGREIPMGLSAAAENRWAFTTREPIGVVAAISAFNHPLNLIVHQVAPAIAVGCPVIVKPATTTPLSCLDLVALVHEAGLPEPWCQSFVPEGNELAERLATDRRVAFLSFIGSARVGWSLHAKLAHGARSALEHGGAAPAIVDRSADLGKVIEPIVKGGYYHAGQVCVSTQRIFVHGDIADDFTQRLVARVETLRTADPVLKDTEVGPLILPREADRVAEWVEEAVKGGATLATGGRRLSETTLQPAVLLDPGRREDIHAGDLRPGGRGVSLRQSRRGDRAGQRPAHGLPGQRLRAGHRRRDARGRSSGRLGRHDQRSHRVPDRLDAFRRPPRIRLRHRRHPLHDARPGTGEDDPDAAELRREEGEPVHVLKVAIAGFGGVGRATADLVLSRRDRYRRLYGADVRLVAVCGSTSGLADAGGLAPHRLGMLEPGLTGPDFIAASGAAVLVEAGPSDYRRASRGLPISAPPCRAVSTRS
jgi:hypothetical protein